MTQKEQPDIPITKEEAQAMTLVVERMKKLGVVDICLPPELWRIIHGCVLDCFEGEIDDDIATILATIEMNMNESGFDIDGVVYDPTNPRH